MDSEQLLGYTSEMNNVIDLTSVRARAAAQSVDDGFFTDVDFRDVMRHSQQDGTGGYVDSLDDAVTLGPTAKEQVCRIFNLHGLRRTPDTWGQLLGNLNYCSLLDSWLTCFAPTQPSGMRALATSDHNRKCPGRGALLGLLADGDLDGAWSWHQQHATFTKNAQDPALTSVTDDQ